MKTKLTCFLFGHTFLRYDRKENASYPWENCRTCGLTKEEVGITNHPQQQ